jgi:hypothetical protein
MRPASLVLLSARGIGLVGLLALAACGGDSDGPGEFADAGYNCAIETRDEDFFAGMEKVGAGGLTFRLVSSTPAPPSRDNNAWDIELLSGSEPVSGATLKITPFMPDHRHGTSIKPVITPGQDPGRYNADPINLWMPGLWEVTIKATTAGDAPVTDEVVFRFCIAS